VSGFVLWGAVRFNRNVNRQPAGRLVLLMVIGNVMTWAALAAFATLDLTQNQETGALTLSLFLVWAGSMVLVTYIVHRWGSEAVRMNVYHQELARMDEMKSQLINTVAHEINTPLTPIRFRVSTLRAAGFGPVTGKQVDALDSIARNLDRVDTIVATMVLTMQLQAGKVQLFPRPTDLGGLVAERVERLRPTATEKGLELRLREGGQGANASVDPDRFATVVDALLSNAVKFTPSGGRIDARVVPNGSTVAVEVHDTGVGLSPEAQAALFQPLRQGRPMENTEPGAGLGLSIAQSIAKLHGGEVTVASDGPGKGSTFRVVVPRDAGAVTPS